jgi:peptidase inhibitor family I36
VTVRRWGRLLAVVVAGALLMTAAPAGAAERTGSTTVRASYRGSMIDLASGWRGAQTCAVFSRTDVRCFASAGEADAALGNSRASDPLAAVAPAALPACTSGWLCLYEFVNGGGRRLQFHDEFWNYLSDYGFDRQTSSWRNNQGSSDAGALSLYNRSTVYPCGANSYESSMGLYDNQAYAVWG